MSEDMLSHNAYNCTLTRRTPRRYRANTMPKELKNKKEDKKKPTMTPKEKKAAKRSKKEGKLVKSA